MPPPVPPRIAAPPSPSRAPTPVSFDLDDPFAAGDRPAVAPPVVSSRPTPLPSPAPGFGELDEPSFVGKLPATSAGQKLSDTRPFAQPVPAFNLDDPSVVAPMPTAPPGARADEAERTMAHDFRPSSPELPANLPELPVVSTSTALPAIAPELPANVPELPAGAAPSTTQVTIASVPGFKPPIGARPSSPTVQAVMPPTPPVAPAPPVAPVAVAPPEAPTPPAPPPSISSPAVPPVKPPVVIPSPAAVAAKIPSSPAVPSVADVPLSSGLVGALSSLPPSIAAAIKPPPPRTEPSLASTFGGGPSTPSDEPSIPSFKLDAQLFSNDEASIFGGDARPAAGADDEKSVPSFRIDADDIFGGAKEPGAGTLVARSPFDPTMPETPRAADPEPRVEARPEPKPVASYALDDESTRAMPTARNDGELPPVVVPPPLAKGVANRPPPPPVPMSPITSTLNAGATVPPAQDTLRGPGRASMPAVPVVGAAPGAPAPSGAARPTTQPTAGIAVPLLLDVTPLSLGVETAGGQCETVIRRNATIPVEQTRVFSTTNDEQTSVVIRIAQGESRRFTENQALGALELTGLRSAPRGEVSVAVTFELGADGTLTVRARDVETGREQATRVSLLTIPTEQSQAEMAARQRTAVAAVG